MSKKKKKKIKNITRKDKKCGKAFEKNIVSNNMKRVWEEMNVMSGRKRKNDCKTLKGNAE